MNIKSRKPKPEKQQNESLTDRYSSYQSKADTLTSVETQMSETKRRIEMKLQAQKIFAAKRRIEMKLQAQKVDTDLRTKEEQLIQKAREDATRLVNRAGTLLLNSTLKHTAISSPQSISPQDIRFSQFSVSYSKYDYNYSSLLEMMKTEGWKCPVIDIVLCPDGKMTSLDNTRLRAAKEADINVLANVHLWDEEIGVTMAARFPKPLSPSDRMKARFYERDLSSAQLAHNSFVHNYPKTWGEALSNRLYGSAISEGLVLQQTQPTYGFDRVPKLLGTDTRFMKPN